MDVVHPTSGEMATSVTEKVNLGTDATENINQTLGITVTNSITLDNIYTADSIRYFCMTE